MEKGKERLFEVMGRLDKTFKPKLNEEIGDMGDGGMPDTGQAPDFQDMPAPEAMPDEEAPAEEKSPEEKLADLTAKVDEMYAILHGEEEAPAEEPVGEPEEIEVTTGEVDVEVDPENLQEWNFDKKKGEKEDDKEEKKDDKEDDETEVEVKVEVEESEKKKEKIPVAAVAKVGK